MRMRLAFANTDQLEFARHLLQRPALTYFGAHFKREELAVELDESSVGRLLSRIPQNLPVILPYPGKDRDAWLITAQDRRDLDLTLAQVSRFVVPSYAEFAGATRTPQLKLFDSNGGEFQQLGARLYPAGYYSLHSPPTLRERVLQRLELWNNLQTMQPPLRVDRQPAYRDLYDTFNSALAAHNWNEAEESLHEIERLNLSTADNLAFLGIQLLAQQQRWRAIWQHPDYDNIAKMRMPRPVRAALITAFHHSELLPLEQQRRYDLALQAFERFRPKLGQLLIGRFDLTDPPVVQVVAYQAAYVKDRQAFDVLRALPFRTDIVDPDDVKLCLDYLDALLPAVEVGGRRDGAQTILTPLQRATFALAERDFDTASQAVSEVDDQVLRSRLSIEIAAQSNDARLAEDALLLFWSLPEDAQTSMQTHDAYIRFCLDHLTRLTTSPEDHGVQAAGTGPAAVAIHSWTDWLDLAQTDPTNPALEPALQRLKATTDERSWTAEVVRALNERLMAFIINGHWSAHSTGKPAVRALIDLFLKDLSFPRSDDEYGELYETLYLALLETEKLNETSTLALLRLAEARLKRNPGEVQNTFENLRVWFKVPLPTLQALLIDAFELLAEYGLQAAPLAPLYREWLTTLLSLPVRRERADLESWLLFGDWIQPGSDLLNGLRAELEKAVEEDTDNPVTALPAGYRIAIFSLRESSAQRAKELLLGRNPSLDIRLSLEKDLSEQAKATAQNADMVVIVATCISHATTYGIMPVLSKDPVYPVSSGSTSIVRAVEGYLRRSSHGDLHRG